MSQLALLIGAALASWLVFTYLLRVLRTTLKTALLLSGLCLGLWLGFGLQPQQLLNETLRLTQLSR
jgi:succinate-acetate transporter protein